MRILVSGTIALVGAAVLSAMSATSAQGPAAPGTGAVVGVITFTDPVPKAEKLLVNQNADICGVTKASQAFLVSPKTKGLGNVVLSVEGVADPPEPRQAELQARIAQQKCMYQPHVQVARVGTTLEVVNVDPILHNIHTYLEPSKRTIFNIGQPIKNQVNKIVLKDDGLISVKCDVHNWMSAFIVVTKHPYVAVSDENGTFRIANVPRGRYKLRAWHEELGSMDKEVTVAPGTEARVNFEIGK